MGTRSTTKVVDSYGNTLINLYRQFDGYLEGHGQELIDFLEPFQLVNGIGAHNPEGRIANGIQCLAAQLIAEFKTEVGGFYMVPADEEEEYNYTIQGLETNGIRVTCEAYDENYVLEDGKFKKVVENLLEPVED
jgi:hypothetical protein